MILSVTVWEMGAVAAASVVDDDGDGAGVEVVVIDGAVTAAILTMNLWS